MRVLTIVFWMGIAVYFIAIIYACDLMYKSAQKNNKIERQYDVCIRAKSQLIDDIEELGKIIAAECMQCDSIEKSLVGSVVINRTETEGYPNSIHEVIYDRGAFYGKKNPQFVYEPESYRIASKLLCGFPRDTDILFFYRNNMEQPDWIDKIIYKKKYHNFGK